MRCRLAQILSTPASKVSNIADLDVGGIGRVVPLQPETESVAQPAMLLQKPKATGGKPDFLAWADDKDAVPVLLDNETQFGKNLFYDGRVNQMLRVSDGKPVAAPEKPGHVYHKPIIVPYPYPNEDDSEWQAFIRFGRLWHHQWQDWCEIPIDMPSEIMDKLKQNLHDFHLWIGMIEEWEREKEENE